MTIDAEVHFWKYGKGLSNTLIRDNKSLREDYLPEQLALNLQRNRVDACIAAAAEPTEVETRFLAELALTHQQIRGVIGRIDLTGKDAAEKINELSSYTAIRAFKTSIPKDPDALQPVMESLRALGYSLDLILSADSDIHSTDQWIHAFPEQSFILENGGNPDTKQAPTPDWADRIKRLARNPNLFCKAAGFFTAGNWKSWKPADFYPFLDVLFDAFGPDRMLFASDWPFLLLSGSYVQWKSLLEKYTERLSETEREGFFGQTAQRVYHL